MVRRIWALGLLLALALPIGSCGSDGSRVRHAARATRTARRACLLGFSDGSRRCGSGTGETNCRVR